MGCVREADGKFVLFVFGYSIEQAVHHGFAPFG
jgi:hypothetical protein